jgi:dTDP-4-amino-4,6-dideoxygalactose transaminase
MADWRVPLTDLLVPEDDIAAVADTYRSGWLSMGPQTAAFEQEFAAFAGAREAIAVANGTAALHLACLAAGFGQGDEVLVPSLTFVATVNAIAYTGATPVFVDVAGLDRPWLSASGCAKALGPRTKGIMAMAYGGHAGEIEALRSVADDHRLILIEDAAHAAGSRLRGRHLGTFGDIGAFSFFSNKNLGIGEGGMVVTDDPELAKTIRLMRSHGMTTLSWDRYEGHASTYDVVALGFNYRLDEPRAAFARCRLARLDDDNRSRARLDARYREALTGLPVTCALPPAEGLASSHHLFTIVLDEGMDRAAFRGRLTEARVETSVHYPPAHRFSIYAGSGAELPLTEAYADRSVTLPMFGHMSDEQQDEVVAAVGAAAAVLTP